MQAAVFSNIIGIYVAEHMALQAWHHITEEGTL